MSQLLYDLRLAYRALVRRPTAAAVMILTLALGLAANAAIFGVIDALVLHPFDFDQVDRLVDLRETSQQEEFGNVNLAPANFRDLREQSGGMLEALVGFEFWDTSLRGREAPVRLRGVFVSPEFFHALRVRPELGRGFVTGEDAAQGPPPVVVSDELWRRQLGGAPDALGKSVELDGTAYTVVGVAPHDFAFPQGAQVWAPLRLDPSEAAQRDRHYLGAFGRLRPGITLAQAREHFAVVARRLGEAHPDTNRGRGVETTTLSKGFQDAGLAPIVSLWQAAALFVLLIGWVNLTNLVLARGAERQHELALLDALGAGRLRLARLQITEGALVALAAALVSLPAAWLALRLIRDGMPVRERTYVEGWDHLGLEPRLFAFTFALALLSVLAISAWPALRNTGRRLASALREGGRSGAMGGRGPRGRALLVVGEVAAALVLVIMAAVSVRGATKMIDGPQGFDRHGLLTMKVALAESRYPDPASRRVFVRDALARLAVLPGVSRAAVSNVLPSAGENASRTIAIEGQPEPDRANSPMADSRTVSPGYFATLGLPIVEGRAFTSADDENALPVAIVSRALAERYWPGIDPIGRRFRAGDADSPWLTVVGIAGDHIHDWFARRDYPTYFQPYAQQSRLFVSFAVRTAGEPDAWRSQVRTVFAGLDPYQPIYDLMSEDDAIHERGTGLSYISAVLSVMAVLALILALSGVYAVMAYTVSLRVREIGVRVALGATVRDVLRMTLGRTLGQAGIGIVLGLAGGLALARQVTGAMRGVAGIDLGLLAGSVVLLALTALAAGIVPARRALALDPAEVLRGE